MMSEQPQNAQPAGGDVPPGYTPPPPPPGYTPPNAAPPPNYGTPPPPGYQPPPGYGYPLQPGMPGPMYLEPPNSAMAIVSLVAGIAGFVGFLFIGPLVAVIFGHLAMNEINNSQGRVGGKGMATAGLILGYVGLGLTVLGLIFFFVFIGVIGTAIQNIPTPTPTTSPF